MGENRDENDVREVIWMTIVAMLFAASLFLTDLISGYTGNGTPVADLIQKIVDQFQA
jgi:hypothetical protein